MDNKNPRGSDSAVSKEEQGGHIGEEEGEACVCLCVGRDFYSHR